MNQFATFTTRSGCNFWTQEQHAKVQAAGKVLELTVTIEADLECSVTKQQVDETKTALRELGLNNEVENG